jgi:hypothetical protein
MVLPSLESTVVCLEWQVLHLFTGILLVAHNGTCSCRGYHWATGFLGLSSISNQWSLAIPMNIGPRAVHPITSLQPILKDTSLK